MWKAMISLNHEIDVALTDGFTGNVLLKTCEATAKAFGKWLKEELQANPLRMMGAACASGAFRAMKARLSADSVGGSPLLGVRGVTIIAHGSSTPRRYPQCPESLHGNGAAGCQSPH